MLYSLFAWVFFLPGRPFVLYVPIRSFAQRNAPRLIHEGDAQRKYPVETMNGTRSRYIFRKDGKPPRGELLGLCAAGRLTRNKSLSRLTAVPYRRILIKHNSVRIPANVMNKVHTYVTQ